MWSHDTECLKVWERETRDGKWKWLFLEVQLGEQKRVHIISICICVLWGSVPLSHLLLKMENFLFSKMLYRIPKSMSLEEQAQVAGSPFVLWNRASSPQARWSSLTLHKPQRELTRVHNQCHHLQTCELPGSLSPLLVTPLDNCHGGTRQLSYIRIVFQAGPSASVPRIFIYSSLSDCSRRQNHTGTIQKTQVVVHPRNAPFPNHTVFPGVSKVRLDVRSTDGPCFPTEKPRAWMDPNSWAILD